MTQPVDKSPGMPWDPGAAEKFRQMLARMPVFARPMAEKPVARKAEALAATAGEAAVGEQHLVDAFFEITPFGFHGPMMTDMEQVGLDYRQFGHPRDYTK